MNAPITALMTAASTGAAGASEALFSALYSELHRLARRELGRGGGAAVNLGVTTLLHEAYIDICGREATAYPDRARFMGYAARVMRGLLIDHVRNGRAQKRGGQFVITALDVDVAQPPPAGQELARLGDAIDELGQVDAGLAEVVDLKFFCGFSFAEIGGLRGVSERTVQRSWEKARLYLHRTMRTEMIE